MILWQWTLFPTQYPFLPSSSLVEFMWLAGSWLTSSCRSEMSLLWTNDSFPIPFLPLGSEPNLTQPGHDNLPVNAIGPEWTHDFSWPNQTNGTIIYPRLFPWDVNQTAFYLLLYWCPFQTTWRAGQDNINTRNQGDTTQPALALPQDCHSQEYILYH